MKTKMKTILSIFMLTAVFYACKKDTPTPDPIIDCMEIENGLAVNDDCGDCHQSYMYAGMGQLTYVSTYEDTVGYLGCLYKLGQLLI